jgi:GxxExxY protein
MSKELVHKELSESIRAAGMAVLNELKPGLDEKLYERALVIELMKKGHRIEQQKEFPVCYDQQLIGILKPDRIVDEAVICDPKVVAGFNEAHEVRMICDWNITGLRLALLLNFKNPRLEWKLIVR